METGKKDRTLTSSEKEPNTKELTRTEPAWEEKKYGKVG